MGRTEFLTWNRLEAEHSATIVRLDSRFAHDGGLPCRSSRNTASPARVQAQASKRRSKTIGISNPEIQKKVFGPRWEHEIEKQDWPFWKRLMHRAGLSDMQAQITNSKTSMSANACFQQLPLSILPFAASGLKH